MNITTASEASPLASVPVTANADPPGVANVSSGSNSGEGNGSANNPLLMPTVTLPEPVMQLERGVLDLLMAAMAVVEAATALPTETGATVDVKA